MRRENFAALHLEFPDRRHEARYLDMMREWGTSGKINPGSLRGGDDYVAWLTKISRDRFEETCPPGKVPQHLFFLVDGQERLLGAIGIRPRLNRAMWLTEGHIGYGIRPSARGLGYAKEQLRLALLICKAMGLDRVLVTCNDDNHASRAVIKSLGGVMENAVLEEKGTTVERYWIEQ